MNSSYSSKSTVQVQNSWCGKEWNRFCSPSRSDDLYLCFCLYPSQLFIFDFFSSVESLAFSHFSWLLKFNSTLLWKRHFFHIYCGALLKTSPCSSSRIYRLLFSPPAGCRHVNVFCFHLFVFCSIFIHQSTLKFTLWSV